MTLSNLGTATVALVVNGTFSWRSEIEARPCLLADELQVDVVRFSSGPFGGDQQVGAAIVEGRIDTTST